MYINVKLLHIAFQKPGEVCCEVMTGHQVESRLNDKQPTINALWLGHSFIRRLGVTRHPYEGASECHFNHIFHGIGGLTMDRFLYNKIDVPRSTNIIVLDILTNSLCNKTCTVDQAISTLSKCIEKIRAKSDCPILIPQVTPRRPNAMRPGQESPEDFNQKVEKLNTYLTHSTTNNLFFVKLHGLRNDKYLRPDGVHLTDAGMRRYCLQIKCFMKRVIRPTI